MESRQLRQEKHFQIFNTERKQRGMSEKRVFNPMEDGFTYKDHTWMIGGYIEDFIKTEEQNGENVITEVAFKNNTGYVDNHNTIHIFYDNPRKEDLFPWFTVVEDEGSYKLVYNPYQNSEIMENFKVNRVVNMSPDFIAED